MLLEHGAKVDPLAAFQAIYSNATATLSLLIAHGADIHGVEGRRTSTPLRVAVHCDKTKHVRILLEHGADPMKVWARQTVIEFARERGKVELCEMMEAAIASVSR
jgi:hypothetical protein